MEIELVDLQPSHAARMFELACDPEIRDNLGIRSQPSLDKTQAWIAKALADETMRVYAVCADGLYVGNIVFDQRDKYLATARYSIYLSVRGRGVGTEATIAALKKIFAEWSLYKVWLTVHALNEHGIRCYENIGFRKEGVHRGEFLLGAARIDALYMGILREEISERPSVDPSSVR
jgi:RimJ/RimL family protein N-acetyltransferase